MLEDNIFNKVVQHSLKRWAMSKDLRSDGLAHDNT